MAFSREHAVHQIATDRLFQGAQLTHNLNERHGIKIHEHGQGFLAMAVLTRTFLKCVGNRQIIYDGNPVMRWMVSNLTGSLSSNGTTSSVLECRMVVFCFTVVAVPHCFQAGQRSTSGVEVIVGQGWVQEPRGRGS